MMKLTDEEINNDVAIESKIIPELAKKHDEWIKNAEKRKV